MLVYLVQAERYADTEHIEFKRCLIDETEPLAYRDDSHVMFVSGMDRQTAHLHNTQTAP